MSKVTIEIENAESVVLDLADLFCWWEGFKMGLKLGDPYGREITPVASNGVEAARKLYFAIGDAINAQSI